MTGKANRLINEKSPYLLQHAYNPVDWMPWGDEAFQKARDEDKPVFFSAGYSTCHWCHVMEKESFEDDETAALLNENFVCVKVDREERPDIDAIYMIVCQMLTGGGGWPLTVIMTPDRQPFFAGTYYPKETRGNRIGLIELLPRIASLWKEHRAELLDSAKEITEKLNSSFSQPFGSQPTEELLSGAFSQFEQRFDETYGGFGGAPKFPSPHNLIFLLRYYNFSRDAKALYMVKKTLTEMRLGGIFDHIGLGFHRYSTDKKWLLPHFEKMLYDQALLVRAYTEAYAVTREGFFRETAVEIIDYVQKGLTSPDGAFYSAEDADSDGEEGRFYLWTKKEIEEVLKDDAGLFCLIYNIEQGGNFTDYANPDDSDLNILFLKKNLDGLAEDLRNDKTFLKEFSKSCLDKLNAARNSRIRPFKDDKILTDWNGLMIAALAYAGSILNEPRCILMAENAADFLLSKLCADDGSLYHRFRDGQAAINGTLEDYAYTIWALIELFSASHKPDYLKKAVELTDIVLEKFKDTETGGFYFTAEDSEKLIARQKEIYDGAIPSGNSVMISNLQVLAHITADFNYEHEADLALKAFSEIVKRVPSAFAYYLLGVERSVAQSYQVVLAGVPANPNTKRFLRELRSLYMPNMVIVLKDTSSDSAILDEYAPYTAGMKSIDNETTIYVCKNFNCELPLLRIEDALKALGAAVE